MSYTGTEGETSAVFRRDLDPLMLGATAATFVAPGSVTNGQFGLYRWDIPAHGGGAGGHFHRGFSESFYVVSGTVTLFNGEVRRAGAELSPEEWADFFARHDQVNL
jgi:hypothetical protein